MRITVAGHAGSPDVDVEVPDGARLGDLRPLLAAVAGRPELADVGPGSVGVAPAVDQVVLDDDHLTGQPPLLPGATLRAGPGPVDPDRVAVRARWHLAVVAGPDCGLLVALDGPVTVGRGRGPARFSDGLLAVPDRTVSARQVLVAPGRRGVVARDLGSRHGTVLVRVRGRPAHLGGTGRRARRLAPGDRLVAGTTVLELRAEGWEPPAAPARADDTAPSGPRPAPARASPSAWLAPAAGGVVLAAATGNRMLLALAAIGPATALTGAAAARCAATVAAWRARGWAGRRAGRRTVGRMAWRRAARSGPPSPRGALGLPGAADVGLPAPVDLRRAVLRALDKPDRGSGGAAIAVGAWSGRRMAGIGRHDGASADPSAAGTGSAAAPDRDLSSPSPRSAVRTLAPGGCMVIAGPRPLALAVARLLVCAEMTGRVLGADDVSVPSGAGAHGGFGDAPPITQRPGVHLDLLARSDDIDAWAWCRWLWPRATTDQPGGGARAGPVANAEAPHDGTLLVVDGMSGLSPPGGRTRSAAVRRRWAEGRGATVVIVVDEPSDVPPWCSTVLCVRDTGEGATIRRDDRVQAVPLRGVSAAWADRQARLLAAVQHRAGCGALRSAAGATRADSVLPRRVSLADLPGVPHPDPDAVAAAWRRPQVPGGLAAHLGAGPGGQPVVVDLVRDGPHALVAGTTGSGKSELLQTWVLALALAYSPADLSVLLVDYKGGAGLGACERLPHVVGQVTDLDEALAARAVAGLRAELRRRERLLARWAVPDLATLRTRVPDAAPPRLLVVVDEFRALVDELPAFVPGLLRVAAQGRSLGIHLLLATQRPGGAVGPDLRANVGIRIALRVTDPVESVDVVDVPDAAAIAPHLVGRAVLRRGPGPTERLQVAHAGTGPSGPPAVAAAPPWRTMVGLAKATLRHSPDPAPAPADRPDPGDASSGRVAWWVDAARDAARQAGLPLAQPPWLPPLPDRVHVTELPTAVSVEGALPLALADLPAEQRRAVVAWRPQEGPLLVVGGPASGRTTALRAVAAAALDRGWHVHAVTTGSALLDVRAGGRGVGTSVGVDDPRRIARLLGLLLDRPGPAVPRPPQDGPRPPVPPRPLDVPGPPVPPLPLDGPGPPDPPLPLDGPGAAVPLLLLVDGLEAVTDALAAVARGRGADRLLRLLRDGGRCDVGIAATASRTVPQVLASPFTHRLVLPVGDAFAEAMAGVPGHLAGARRGPGRAVWVPGAARHDARADGDAGTVGVPALCQVVLRTCTDAAADLQEPAAAARRLAPVPEHVTAADLDRARRVDPGSAAGDRGRRRDGDLAGTGDGDRAGTGDADGRSVPARPRTGEHPMLVPVGLGGDDGGPVLLPVDRGALVVGPPGSGRSTTLAVIAGQLLDRGCDVVLVARDGPLRSLGRRRTPSWTCGPAGAAVDRALEGALGRSSDRRSGAPVVVVVDDVELLDQLAPSAATRIADLAAPSLGDADGDLDGDAGGDSDRHADVTRPPPAGADAAHAADHPAAARGAASRPRVVLVAAASTATGAVAYRGLLGSLRTTRRGVVLSPSEPGSGEVFGVDLAWAADPARPYAPGRGVVVDGRDVRPVQVARC